MENSRSDDTYTSQQTWQPITALPVTDPPHKVETCIQHSFHSPEVQGKLYLCLECLVFPRLKDAKSLQFKKIHKYCFDSGMWESKPVDQEPSEAVCKVSTNFSDRNGTKK